jgi:hypothetical protein
MFKIGELLLILVVFLSISVRSLVWVNMYSFLWMIIVTEQRDDTCFCDTHPPLRYDINKEVALMNMQRKRPITSRPSLTTSYPQYQSRIKTGITSVPLEWST